MNRTTSTTRTSVAKFLQQAIAKSGKTYDQIAADVGFDRGNTIKMMAEGMSKLPINTIKSMAAALGVDPAHLLGLVLADYYSGLAELIEELFDRALLSQNEKRLIAALRAHTEGNDAQAVVCDAREVIAVVMV